MLLKQPKFWTWITETGMGGNENECGSGLLGVTSNKGLWHIDSISGLHSSQWEQESFPSPSTRWAASAILSSVRDQMCRLWACFTPSIFSRSSFTSSKLMWFGVPGERGGGEGIEGEEGGGEGTSRDVGAIESHHLASSSSTHILVYVSVLKIRQLNTLRITWLSHDHACQSIEHIANHMTITWPLHASQLNTQLTRHESCNDN